MLKDKEGIRAGKTVSPSQDLCLRVSWRLEDPPGYVVGMARTQGYSEDRLDLRSEPNGHSWIFWWWAEGCLTYLAGGQAGSSTGPAKPVRSGGGSVSLLWTPSR